MADAMKDGDDPKDFGVAEVNEYLKNASPEERDRVLAAEEGGKNRSTVKAPSEGEGDGDASAESSNGTGGVIHNEGDPSQVGVASVTSEVLNGPVPPGGEAEPDKSGPVEGGFKFPDTHDDGEKAAVERTIAKKVGGSADEGSD